MKIERLKAQAIGLDTLAVGTVFCFSHEDTLYMTGVCGINNIPERILIRLEDGRVWSYVSSNPAVVVVSGAFRESPENEESKK